MRRYITSQDAKAQIQGNRDFNSLSIATLDREWNIASKNAIRVMIISSEFSG